MSYFDFSNLSEWIGSKYAEVQEAFTRQRASSETVQVGEYEFTITTLPASGGFWSSSKVLISLEPVENVRSQAILTVSDKRKAAELLQTPDLLEKVLECMDLIKFDFSEKLLDLQIINQQTIVGAFKMLKQISEDPKTPKILRKTLQEQENSALLQDTEPLEETFELINSLNPFHLEEEDGDIIRQLSDIAYNPGTPPLLQKAIFQKIYETHKSISSRAMSGVYGIPQEIVNTLQEKGSYLVTIPKTIGGSTEERKELSLDDLARDCNKKHPPKIKQAGTWKYFEAPYDPNSIGENSNGNLLAVSNTDPDPKLKDATMEHLIEKSKHMLSELKKSSITNEKLLQIKNDLQEIQTVVNARRTVIDNCTKNLKIINTFRSPTFENPEQKTFSAATVGSGQTLTRARMALQELDKVISNCQTELEARTSKNKNPGSQESAATSVEIAQ